MKSFISAEDIEAVAERGQKEFTIGTDTVLTDMARRTAETLGVRLIETGKSSSMPARSHAAGNHTATVAAPFSGKPKGCQSLLVSRSDGPAVSARTDDLSPVVDQLVRAIQSRGAGSGSRRS